MAKAKKAESGASGSSASGSASGAAKKKKAKAETSGANPLIDTSLAAESAAKRVAAGFSPAAIAPSQSGDAPVRESAWFKHLKESLNKPASAGLANILDKTAGPGQKKPNLPFHAGKQVGRNQTFGADVNRSGVPRRTGGG